MAGLRFLRLVKIARAERTDDPIRFFFFFFFFVCLLSLWGGKDWKYTRGDGCFVDISRRYVATVRRGFRIGVVRSILQEDIIIRRIYSRGYRKRDISQSLEDIVISIYLSFSNLFLHLCRFFPLYFQFRYTSFLLFPCDPRLPPFDSFQLRVRIYDILACLILCAILTTKPVSLPS